ncbi:MAG: VTT domain-containing protein [Planctomycetota bacterium]
MRDAGCAFRAIRREALRELPVFNGMHRFLPTLLRYQGFRVVEVEVESSPAYRGQLEVRHPQLTVPRHRRLLRDAVVAAPGGARQSRAAGRRGGTVSEPATTPRPPRAAAVELPFTVASVIKPIALVLIVVASLYALHRTPLGRVLEPGSVQSFRDWVNGFGSFAPLVFTLIATGLIALGAPRLLFAALAGVVFGFLLGSLLAQVASVAACMLDFGYGRWLGREFVARRLHGRLGRLGRLLELVREHGLVATIWLRTAPVGHAMTLNLLLSVSPISMRDFFLGTLIGTVPGTCIYALFGSAAEGDRLRRLLLGTAVLLALSLAYLWYLRRLRRKGASAGL